MIKTYMLVAPPVDGAMYAFGPDKIEIANSFKVGDLDGNDITVVAIEDSMLPTMMTMPEYLAGGAADLALRHPDIAKLVFTVEVQTADGNIEQVPYGAVTKGMAVLSPAQEPILIMGETEK